MAAHIEQFDAQRVHNRNGSATSQTLNIPTVVVEGTWD